MRPHEGWPNGLASLLVSRKKPKLHAYHWLIRFYNNRLLDWSNGKILASTCVQIWAQPKSTQVHASPSPRKWVAKRNASWTQVQKQVTQRPWDLWKHQKRLVFLLHLELFRFVGLSKRKIIEPSLTAFTEFVFLSWLHVRSWKAFNCHSKSKLLTAKTNLLTAKANQLRMRYFYNGGQSVLEVLLLFTVGHRYHS